MVQKYLCRWLRKLFTQTQWGNQQQYQNGVLAENINRTVQILINFRGDLPSLIGIYKIQKVELMIRLLKIVFDTLCTFYPEGFLITNVLT